MPWQVIIFRCSEDDASIGKCPHRVIFCGNNFTNGLKEIVVLAYITDNVVAIFQKNFIKPRFSSDPYSVIAVTGKCINKIVS